MPKVSVIMPSLNVVAFIKQCVESVINQTLDDIEIIAVDAGSNDGTLEILKEYAANTQNFKLIISDKKSYGYQMNLGIKAAEGDYIGIVETDDLIPYEALENLYVYAVNNDLDYAKGYPKLFYEFSDNTVFNISSYKFTGYDELTNKIINPSEMPELLVGDYYIWNGIYKKSFIKQIRFNETPGAAFQDQGFLLRSISKAHRAAYLDKHVYNYRQSNPNSSVYNKNGFKYIHNEYKLNYEYAMTLSEHWICAFFTRMLNQTVARIRVLASADIPLDESDIEVSAVLNLLKSVKSCEHINTQFMNEQNKLFYEYIQSDPQKLYNYFKDMLLSKKDKMDSILDTVNGEPIVIFSYGQWGKKFFIVTKYLYNADIAAFCDNNTELTNEYIDSTPVISPESAVKKYPDAFYIIANSTHYEEMRAQLISIGIRKEKIIHYIFENETALLNCSYIRKKQ